MFRVTIRLCFTMNSFDQAANPLMQPQTAEDCFADTTFKDTGGSPLLLGLAAELHGQTMHAEICRAVLKRAGIVERDPPHPEINTMHTTAGTALHWACAQRLVDESLALLACRHFTLLNAKRKSDGSTALHIAAAEGMDAVVESMLLHPDSVEATAIDADGFTPLHGAAYNGHTTIVRRLLAVHEFSHKVGVLGAFDTLRPAGHWAAEAAADYDVCSALHMAATQGHAQICDLILSRGPAETTAADATNRVSATALHMAARKGHTAACLTILKHSEFTAVDAKDVKGFTALHWAAHQPSGEICAAILARSDLRAADVEAKDLKGRTAADIAKDSGHHEVYRLILYHVGAEGTQ
mmetsp:Transcript_3671/g.7241  ORF Transcript_3671/g.7241 Transcript_3671/m.7241 type:complete len:353 (-) Transcript_3671:116-1174(-)